MNILNNRAGTPAVLPPQIMQGISQIKQMQSLFNGTPQQMIQQMAQSNPIFNEVIQMCKGQNPQQVFEMLCKQRGIDGNAILKELQK